MTARDLAILLIRLLAINTLVSLIIGIPNYVLVYQNGNLMFSLHDLMLRSFEYMIVPGVIVIIMWFFADIIADKVTLGLNTSEKFGPFTLSEILPLAVSLLGIYILTYALSSFVQFVMSYLRFKDSITSHNNNIFTYSGILSSFLRTIIGFYLLLGSRGISEFINRPREARLPKIDN